MPGKKSRIKRNIEAPAMRHPIIGESVPRKEGLAKVTGKAIYTDDVTFPDMLYGATVRSQIARGKIRAIHFDPAMPWDEFVVVTAKDIPGKNCITLLEDDQPCLAADIVNHPEEPIVLLAHKDKYLVEEARRSVRIEIDPLPAIFTMEDSLASKEVIWRTNNIFKSLSVDKGDVDAAWATADKIIEGEYETGAQEQLYIEPQGMIATANPNDGVTVWGSLQCPYYIHKALSAPFGLLAEKIRVVQLETGGGFGGKEEYPLMIAPHASLLAWKSGKPVKIVYDRAEDMAATTKRHPSRTRHRTAVTRDGKLVAADIEFCLDGGAYSTLSSTVLSRGTIHSGGPYCWPNIRVRSKAFATNTPPHGAFRGFGAPQSLFATERHMDRVAKAVGLSPEEFRRRNLLRTGETTGTGQTIHQQINLEGWMERALDHAGYYEKRARFDRENPDSLRKKGVGFA